MRHLPFAITLLIASSTLSQSFYSPHFEIKKLSPFVYAAIAKNGGYAICNAGVVDLGKEVLVFDPFMTPQAAEDLLKFIQTTIKKPVKYVVNSHAHNDHIRGTQVFNDATVIATPAIAKAIKENEPLDIADEKSYAPARMKHYDSIGVVKDKWQSSEDSVWRGYFRALVKSNPTLRTVIPNLLFSDSISVSGSNTSVQLITLGDGHTDSDLFMYLPKEKIAFMGDLLFVQDHPWIGESKGNDWIDYLKKIQQMNITTFIPGHGSVGNSNDLAQMISYLQSINRIASELKDQHPTDEMIANKLPSEFSSWHFKNFYNFNVKYAMKHQNENK